MRVCELDESGDELELEKGEELDVIVICDQKSSSQAFSAPETIIFGRNFIISRFSLSEEIREATSSIDFEEQTK